MEKDTILGYIVEVKDLMEEGRFIQAFKIINFIIINIVNESI